jgi:hypothetical protein
MPVVLALILGWHAAARGEGVATFVDDPAILAALESKGFGFEGLFGISGEADLEVIAAKSPAYKAIVDMVGADVAALRAEMKAIDMRRLTTAAAGFRLAGVLNRLDRKDFPRILGDKGCGEVRPIYRLAYAFKKKASGWPRGCRSISMPSIRWRQRGNAAATICGRVWSLAHTGFAAGRSASDPPASRPTCVHFGFLPHA